jgi:DNA-binding Lrp family transcriptional regulator
VSLDEKDHQILAELTREARVKNAALARRVGLSPSACLARVRRLERSGVIVGYRAIVGRPGSTERVEGWADIRLVDPTPGLIDQFVRLIEAAPEIVEAHRIAGHYDFIVRFCAGDLTAWNRFRRNLDALGCSTHSRFSILVEPLK